MLIIHKFYLIFNIFSAKIIKYYSQSSQADIRNSLHYLPDLLKQKEPQQISYQSVATLSIQSDCQADIGNPLRYLPDSVKDLHFHCSDLLCCLYPVEASPGLF